MTVDQVITVIEARTAKLQELASTNHKRAAAAATGSQAHLYEQSAEVYDLILNELDQLLALIATSHYHDKIDAEPLKAAEFSLN
jgi:hypothetical protein